MRNSLSEKKELQPSIKVATKPKEIELADIEHKPLVFKINFLHHKGFNRAQIMEMLGVKSKQVVDNVWLYYNKSYRHASTYKEKIEQFLESQKAA